MERVKVYAKTVEDAAMSQIEEMSHCEAWVYGNLMDYGKDEAPEIHGFDPYRIGNESWREITVDPDTVGQYTGLKDKNGVKIFEGDIVEFGKGRYVCEFVEGGFQFKDLDDGRLTLNAIAIKSKVVENIYYNQKLLNKK